MPTRLLLETATLLNISLDLLASATGGNLWRRHEGVRLEGFFTDTRSPVAGGLFVALKGERFDGHAFVEKALQEGAAGVLVSDPSALEIVARYPGRGAVVVKDTREAFLNLGELHRRMNAHALWFAVAGSCGKTSTKEILAHTLAAGAGLRTHRALKSFNNDVGVPTAILGAHRSHQAVVLELGMNHPGEIRPLASAARPNVAVIVNAGPEHLEFMGSLDTVAEENSHVLDFQGKQDAAVLNADDPFCEFWRKRAKGRVVTFGLAPHADVRAEAIEEHPGKGAHFFLCAQQQAMSVQLLVPGRHNVINALAAVAAGLAAKLDLAKLAQGLTTYRGAERRFQIHDVHGVQVIDDAYNANPLSFKAALSTLKDFAGRRIFIVAADMLELGNLAPGYHDDLGGWLAQTGPQMLFTVGQLAERAGRAAVKSGLPETRYQACQSPEEAAERLRPLLTRGDVVLVKGSNGMRLDKCIARLLEHHVPSASAAN